MGVTQPTTTSTTPSDTISLRTLTINVPAPTWETFFVISSHSVCATSASSAQTDGYTVQGRRGEEDVTQSTTASTTLSSSLVLVAPCELVKD